MNGEAVVVPDALVNALLSMRVDDVLLQERSDHGVCVDRPRRSPRDNVSSWT